METQLTSQKEIGPEGAQLNSESKWKVYEVPDRVDAFNFKDFSEQLSSYIENKGPWVALDLSQTNFLSLMSIKFISEKADILERQQGGMAFVGPTEKLKRQIWIYATLENVQVVTHSNRLRN